MIVCNTSEDQRKRDLRFFKLDAYITSIAVLSARVWDLALKVCDMISNSSKSEYRAKYNIIRDYTKCRDVSSAVATMRKAIVRHNNVYASLVEMLSRRTSKIDIDPDFDAGLYFSNRADTGDEEFSRYYADVRRRLIDLFRPYKCSDPVMLYELMHLMFMARRFDDIAHHVARDCSEFAVGGDFREMLYLHVLKPCEQLAHRMMFVDKSGREMVFLCRPDEEKSWQMTVAKKSWQKKYADNPPVVLRVEKMFCQDSLVRASWTLETHMFELKTIDKIIKGSSHYDPEYRKDYRIKRMISSASTYEQSMLAESYTCNRWADFPRRCREYVDSINKRHCIDSRRRPKPVVGFVLKTVLDKNGREVYDNGEVRTICEFDGIWNSSYEAGIERGIPWQKIRQSVSRKASNDGTNHIWISLEDFISMMYSSLQEFRPDVAEELKRLLPEFEMKTTAQIASETNTAQGSFDQAAISTNKVLCQ